MYKYSCPQLQIIYKHKHNGVDNSFRNGTSCRQLVQKLNELSTNSKLCLYKLSTNPICGSCTVSTILSFVLT